MAEMVTIDGQEYKKREPLGVLGLSLITLGIYFWYWYYKINDDLRRFQHDDSISPGRSLLAVTLGWLIIVPPFIAVYNTSMHVASAERGAGIQQELSPAINVILLIVFSIGVGMYTQEHLNRLWDRARTGTGAPPATGLLPPPPA
jgi:hypothetical protein